MQSLLINKVNISARVDTSLQQDEHASASGSQQMPGSSADFYGRRFNTHQVEGANLSLPDSERPIIQQDNIEYSASAAGLIKNARRRTRTVLQPWQREALHAKFKECQSIVGTARQELAQELTLPELTIKTWFQNRRALQKQKTVLAGLSLPDSERPIIQQDNIEYSASAAGPVKNARRKAQSFLQPNQCKILHEQFKKNIYITKEKRQLLAQKLNLTELIIQTWFQNQRVYQKRKTVPAGEHSQQPTLSHPQQDEHAGASGSQQMPDSSTGFYGPIKNKEKQQWIVFKPWQLEELHAKFKECPNDAAHQQLAQKLKLPEATVKIWFQNHRAHQKKQAEQAGEHSQQPTLSYPQQNQKETADSTTLNLSNSANKGMPFVSPIPTGLPNANNLYGLSLGNLPPPAMLPPSMLPFMSLGWNNSWQSNQYQQLCNNPSSNYNNWGANLNLSSSNRVNTLLDIINTATQEISPLPTTVSPGVSNEANKIEATFSISSESSSDSVNESPQTSAVPSTHSTSLQHQNLLQNEPCDDQVAEKLTTIVRPWL